DAAPLRGLGGDAGAGSPADDGAPFRNLLPESGQDLFTVPSHGSVLPSGDPGRAPARSWVSITRDGWESRVALLPVGEEAPDHLVHENLIVDVGVHLHHGQPGGQPAL